MPAGVVFYEHKADIYSKKGIGKEWQGIEMMLMNGDLKVPYYEKHVFFGDYIYKLILPEDQFI